MIVCCPPELVQECRSFLSDNFFRAFTDESRLGVFLVLMENGEMTVNQVAEQMDINQSNVSRHLTLLKQAGVTQARKSGREIYYQIDYQNIAQRLQSILSIVQQCCPTTPEEN
ncbi:MAG: ArsR/SmtB family transcription factor [Fidelibacterota bacterium]